MFKDFFREVIARHKNGTLASGAQAQQLPTGGKFGALFAKVNENRAADSKYAAERKRASTPTKGMKAGGYVKAADGCAKKGKTKGKMV